MYLSQRLALIGTAQEVFEQIPVLVSILDSHALLFKLKINYKLGKTQPILALRGPGANKILARISRDGQIIRCELQDRTVLLQVACLYKHVGVPTTPEQCVGPCPD